MITLSCNFFIFTSPINLAQARFGLGVVEKKGRSRPRGRGYVGREGEEVVAKEQERQVRSKWAVRNSPYPRSAPSIAWGVNAYRGHAGVDRDRSQRGFT
jgi:hypothetical protein